jgi:hypothetical protein
MKKSSADFDCDVKEKNVAWSMLPPASTYGPSDPNIDRVWPIPLGALTRVSRS